MSADKTKYTVADRDTGGRVYSPYELSLVRRSWAWPEGETGNLARAECMLGLARDDLLAALGDFEATGTRPGWVKTTRRLLREVEKTHAAVRAELES